ncbi:MAG: hypothetical protein CUN51_05920 [Candidatus Thermofonsia Clade 1 bacterium]|uniref:DUF304 domain-containing protein n=1 Tax=Candidatus Thermofonsia Clade 1 bacterium TaxID=2364210 RepID=A0A2M8P0E5_9CHLR|nr:MAG: hypothetical protein CUN51_05920 [Candidatus Thermofonsia Clade 1 bacterium]
MAEEGSQAKSGRKYPLVVYRLLARRYRLVSILLIIVGAVAQLPRYVPELRFGETLLSYEQLSIIGLGVLLTGLGLLIASLLEGRLAYAQCKPDYLLINTSSRRVAVGYLRITETKLDIPRNVLETKKVRGRDQVLMKQLSKLHKERVLEVVLSDFPLPEKQLRKRLHRFFLSARSEHGLVLIVPRPESLKFEIDAAIARAREARRIAEQGERDPLAAFRP